MTLGMGGMLRTFCGTILEHLEVHKRCFVKSVDDTLMLVVM